MKTAREDQIVTAGVRLRAVDVDVIERECRQRRRRSAFGRRWHDRAAPAVAVTEILHRDLAGLSQHWCCAVSEARTWFANTADAQAWQIAACDAVLAKIRLQRGESAGARELLNSAASRLQNALGATHPRTLAARTPVAPPARTGLDNAAEAAAATH